ncbi:hypothetical protein GCM10023322_27960 [Rugosimonospora acidiphila]|uniref:WXG100 family type VII secretion target n=1 Tax=Rugosimonospora acidiphila TaxID=556531 RepID=A0ABP9RSR7_9ACTN
MANLSFAIPQVRDCVKFMDDFQTQQDGDQAKYQQIANNLPNNWGSTEVAVFTDGINELSRKTKQMRDFLTQLHTTLGEASNQVQASGEQAKKNLTNAIGGNSISGVINR